MVNINQTVAWKWLKEQIKNIKDDVLRNSIMAEFRKRAMEEWGYNPDTGRLPKEQKIIFDEWEQELVKDIEKAEQYMLDTRKEKRQQTTIEFKNRMRDFITKGGKFSDLPKELQNEHILKGYLDVIYSEIDDCEKILFN